MNHQSEMYLLLNKLRLTKGTIRHTWQSLIGVLFVCGALLYQFLFSVVKITKGAAASPDGTLYILLAVVALNLFRGFLTQTPVLRMDAASALLAYNTKLFAIILRRKQIISAILSFLGSGILSYFLSGFAFNMVFAKMTALITLYFCNCTHLSWIYYHEKFEGKMIATAGIGICTVLFIVASVFSIAGLASLLCMTVLYSWKILKLDLPKYYEHLQKIESAEVAVSQNNYAKMYQLAEENRPAYVRGLRFGYLQSTKQMAVWHKSLLELLRMQKSSITLVPVLLLFGWLVSKSNMLAFLPLLDDPAITGMIAALCVTTALSSFNQLLIKQVQNSCDKRKLGLSLPYPTRYIFFSYGATAAVVNLILSLVICLLYSAAPLRIILLWIVQIVVFLVQCYAQLAKGRFGQGLSVFANILLYAAVHFSTMGFGGFY